MTKKITFLLLYNTQLAIYFLKKKNSTKNSCIQTEKIQSMPIGSCKNKPETCALFLLLVVKSEEC